MTAEAPHKTPTQAAERVLSLLFVTEHAYATEAEPLHPVVLDLRQHVSLSPSEVAFLATVQPTDEQRWSITWRAEAAYALLWALGHHDALYPLNQRCNLADVPVIRWCYEQPADFVAKAQLRPRAILEAAEGDLYHHHWRVRDAQLFQRPIPPDLDIGVVYERRYALTWLVWPEDWDNVSTDT